MIAFRDLLQSTVALGLLAGLDRAEIVHHLRTTIAALESPRAASLQEAIAATDRACMRPSPELVGALHVVPSPPELEPEL